MFQSTSPHVKPAAVLLCDGTPEIEIIDDPTVIVEGIPPGLTREALEIDRQTYSKLKCPNCRKRSMVFVPRHRGGEYMPVARCWRCRAVEQL